MRVGCVHQRAANWGCETVDVVRYTLNSEGRQLREAAIAEAIAAAVEGRIAKLTDVGRALISLDESCTVYKSPGDADPLANLYGTAYTLLKQTRDLTPDEHPLGVLEKPCEVCGHKYGTAWLREAVPADVLAWLRQLPESRILHPWRTVRARYEHFHKYPPALV